ncbi:MAG: hypothetical protein ABIJ56_03110 [Pseudomonadota bacterium]
MPRALALMVFLQAGCFESEGARDDVGGDEQLPEEIETGGDESPDGPEQIDEIIEDEAEEECTPENMCFSDFPCMFTAVCIDEQTVRFCRDVPCWETCGTMCCSGASCGSTGTEECGAGTECFEKVEHTGFDGGKAECLPPPSDASTDDDVDYDGWHRPETYSSWCR